LSGFLYDLATCTVWFPYLPCFSWRGLYCGAIQVNLVFFACYKYVHFAPVRFCTSYCNISLWVFIKKPLWVYWSMLLYLSTWHTFTNPTDYSDGPCFQFKYVFSPIISTPTNYNIPETLLTICVINTSSHIGTFKFF